ncbi:L-threonylcarbamoyladenylate synthase, partial [Auraticoccus cholistanensis]|uniref:L-threonylcarbamoyladenylate synthase n=1 Tax=Auraticoccus cholistanensis TaxID=2656650 RepID=UPI002F910079
MSDEQGYQRFDCTGDELYGGSTAARQAIERGECVVLPTDTVYGIGADAFSSQAVQRLLDAKGRGRDMPPPVLIAEPAILRALATDLPEGVEALVAAHWPGPLTVICKAQRSLQMDLGETNGTIALRVPDHDVTRALLRRTGPLAVSSANRSGQPAATVIDEAVEQLGDRVSVYLDAGPTPGPVASSIVDFTRDREGVLVREGV